MENTMLLPILIPSLGRLQALRCFNIDLAALPPSVRVLSCNSMVISSISDSGVCASSQLVSLHVRWVNTATEERWPIHCVRPRRVYSESERVCDLFQAVDNPDAIAFHRVARQSESVWSNTREVHAKYRVAFQQCLTAETGLVDGRRATPDDAVCHLNRHAWAITSLSL
jgi:hypothetical protein